MVSVDYFAAKTAASDITSTCTMHSLEHCPI